MSTSSLPYWPKGVPRTLNLPQVPLTHYVQVAAERYPNKPAVIFCGSTLSYAALLARVEALAGYLTQRVGVQRGDRVLLMSQNCPQYVAAYYGIMRAGAVVVPVNAMCTQSEIRYYLQDSGARVAMVAQELLPQVMPLLQPGDAVIVSGSIGDHGVAVLGARHELPFHSSLTSDCAPLNGLIGQVLYLQAEAEGFRGTGIGCFFDDAVHELLGIQGGQWQALYHFTVGVPVTDARIGVEPPYAHRASTSELA